MTWDNLPSLYPVLILALGMLAVLVAGLTRAGQRRETRLILFIGLVALALAGVAGARVSGVTEISGLFRSDAFSRFVLFFGLITTGLTLVLANNSREVAGRRMAEFTAILLALCTGLFLMSAATDLLMAYLAMELVSLSSYILTGFRRADLWSHEAALKYVIYGGVASGIMVFGMSLLYGLTGTTSFAGISRELLYSTTLLGAGQVGELAVVVAGVFVFAGFCFKIAAVPFHQWCPDVYQGAPTPFTGFLSVAPKAAGFALILRFLAEIFPAAGAHEARWPLITLLGIISAVTMTLGNFTALNQLNVKRLLAYSSIAHAGYMLMGVIVLDTDGTAAVMLYLIVYLFMNLGAFAIIQLVSDSTGSSDLPAFTGLGTRAPLLAVFMGVFLFSLAGLPPLAGFIGKFYLFAALLRTNQFWLVMLAVVGILNSVVALFYYVRILREMFLRAPEGEAPVTPAVPAVVMAVLALLVVPTLVFGIYWEPIRSLAVYAATALNLM